MHKHQYESAIYIGDKLLAITSKHSKSITRVQATHLVP